MRFAIRALGLVFGLLMAVSASAGVVVETTSNIGAGFRIGGSIRQVELMTWTQSTTYTDVAISALVGSLSGSNELFEAYLTTAVGPGATAADVVASTVKTAPAKASVFDFTSVSLFTGLSLAPGTYYLVLYNSDTNPASLIRWARGNSTTLGAGVSGLGGAFANNGTGLVVPATPYQSTFVISTLNDFAFSVTGTAVPEPSTFASALLALIGVGAARRLRRRV
ncbi:MAG: hypothetical protein SFX72_15640 [Isosphaeraceae bacterium]|nr:hypothetical protein [Isosphaeraceae bacterium]